MFPFLATSNVLPYIVIVVMAYGMYWQFDKLVEARQTIEIQEASINGAFESMHIIQSANEDRLKALEGVRSKKWSEGRHESSF